MLHWLYVLTIACLLAGCGLPIIVNVGCLGRSKKKRGKHFSHFLELKKNIFDPLEHVLAVSLYDMLFMVLFVTLLYGPS